MSVTYQLGDHRARCLAHLISLRMLAQTEPGALLPRRVVVEIARATGAVVAEAEAAGQAVLTAGPSDPHRRDVTFLRVRLDRLAAAAEDTVAAARAGDAAELRRHLRRFDTLTAAIWAVQDALYDAHPVPSEYHNVGGWPVHGFSQSSGLHDVWNFWIVYPLGAWVLVLAAHAWFTYGNKPISEDEIRREMKRQAARDGRA